MRFKSHLRNQNKLGTPIGVPSFFFFGCREEMGFEPQGLRPFEPGLLRCNHQKFKFFHLSSITANQRSERRGLCPPPQWRHTASFGVSARQIADNLETNFQKSEAGSIPPTAEYCQLGAINKTSHKHLGYRKATTRAANNPLFSSH